MNAHRERKIGRHAAIQTERQTEKQADEQTDELIGPRYMYSTSIATVGCCIVVCSIDNSRNVLA